MSAVDSGAGFSRPPSGGEQDSPTEAARRLPARLRLDRSDAIVLLLIVVAFVVGAVSLSLSNENAIGGYGLISALPIIYFVAVGVVVAGLLWTLRLPQQTTVIMVVGIIALVVLVHGAASFVESQARFPVAWLHAGFIDSIMQLGHTTTSYDARFSWPGFFSGGAVLTEVTGVSGPTVWLKWAPPVMVLCYVPLLLAIGRATLRGWRAPWIGVIVFVMADWVGQDYFSPQSVAYIMYLAIIAVLLTYFRRRKPDRLSHAIQGWPQRLPHWLTWLGSMIESGRRSQEPKQTPASQQMRIGLLIAIGLITLAMVSSHQLTPLIMVAALAVLAVVGRLRPWPLFLFVGVAFVGWLSYAAEDYWSGHLAEIFGGIGRVGTVVDSGVTERIQGTQDHLNVLSDRIALSMLVWGLAALSALWMWWRTRTISVALLVLTAAPLCMLATQSYGGEGLLRVFLFSLPGAAMLIAGLVSSTPQAPHWQVLVAAFAAIMLVFPFFLVAKWGNEDFERVSTQDLQVYQALYQAAPADSTIVSFAPGGPAQYEGLTTHSYRQPSVSWPLPPFPKLNREIGSNPLGTYVVLVRPQVAYAVANEGMPPQWGDALIAELVSSGKYKIVYQNPSGVVLQQIMPEPATPATPPPAAAPPAPVAFGNSTGGKT